MNPFFSKILLSIATKRLGKKAPQKKYADHQIEPAVDNLKVEISHGLREFIYVILGVLSAGFGLKGFLLPNHFIDGGATGISLLIENQTTISLGVLLILVNVPFLLLATQTIGKRFALQSIVAISLLAVVVHLVEYPVITEDKLLIAIFGGFFLGLGIGLAMRGGSVIDGTEVLAIYLSRKLGITIGDVLLLINIFIFSFGAYILSIEIALYAILTYLSAAKTVDFVVDGVEEYIGVSIISDFHEEIRIMLTEKMRRSCTISPVKGGYKNNQAHYDKSLVYIIMTRLELPKLHTEIDKIDKKAFVIMSVVKDLKGGTIKRKPLK